MRLETQRHQGAGLSAPPGHMLVAAVRLGMIFDMECGGCQSWLASCHLKSELLSEL
jgi:hypothetical protein